MNARTLGFAVMSLLVVALLVQPAAATYRWSSIEYSRDGVSWARELEPSLFDREVVLAPGGSVQRTVHVANRGTAPVAVGLTVRATSRDAQPWAEAFRVDVRTAAGVWEQVRPIGGVLTTELLVDDAATVPVTVRVSIPTTERNLTAHRLHLDVELAPNERNG